MLHIWINRLRREWVVSNDYIKKKTEQGYRYLMGKMRQGQTDLQQKPLRGEMWTCYSQPTNIIPESAEKWEEKHTSWSGWEIRNKCTWKMLLPSKFVMGFSLFWLQKFSRKSVNYPHWYPLLPLSSLFPQVTPMFFCKPRTSHSSSPLPQTTEKKSIKYLISL